MMYIHKNNFFILLISLTVFYSCGSHVFTGINDSKDVVVLKTKQEEGIVTYDTLGLPAKGIRFIQVNTSHGKHYVLKRISEKKINKYFRDGGWVATVMYGLGRNMQVVDSIKNLYLDGMMPFTFYKKSPDTVKCFLLIFPDHCYEYVPFYYNQETNCLKIGKRRDMYVCSITADTMVCIENTGFFRADYYPGVVCVLQVYRHLSNSEIETYNRRYNKKNVYPPD